MAKKTNNGGTPCKVLCLGRNGYIDSPVDAPSIAAGIRLAKGSGRLRYFIVVDGVIVRKGNCG